MLRSQQFRQLPHSLPCFEAGHVKSPVETVDVQGQNLTGFWSIRCEDIRIIKFFGMLSVLRGKNLASRVGSQWLVSGVRLHTSKIFFKCSTLCRSPLSCHLKTSSPDISAVIAKTHCGCLRLSNLRASASLTFGNLYRPFRA